MIDIKEVKEIIIKNGRLRNITFHPESKECSLDFRIFMDADLELKKGENGATDSNI